MIGVTATVTILFFLTGLIHFSIVGPVDLVADAEDLDRLPRGNLFSPSHARFTSRKIHFLYFHRSLHNGL